MAKIGNEAKLILKLAEGRIQKAIEEAKQKREVAINNDNDRVANLCQGQADGMWYAMTVYVGVISELEAK